LKIDSEPGQGSCFTIVFPSDIIVPAPSEASNSV
jgi:signal transduction histidine kinase